MDGKDAKHMAEGAFKIGEAAAIALTKTVLGLADYWGRENVSTQDCAYIHCPGGMRFDLMDALNHAGIKCGYLADKNGNGAYIFFKKSDMERATLINDRFQQDMKKISLKTFADFAEKNKSVVKVGGVTKEEFLMIQDFVKQKRFATPPASIKNLPEKEQKKIRDEYVELNQRFMQFEYSFQKESDDTYSLYTEPINQNAMKAALIHAGVLSKVPEIKEQYHVSNLVKEDILKKLSTNEEFVVTGKGRTNQIFSFSTKGLEVFEVRKEDEEPSLEKTKFIDKNSIDYGQRVFDELSMTFRQPVILSAEDIFLEQNKKKMKKTAKTVIQEKVKEEYPVVSRETAELNRRLQKELSLIERKMSLDNPASAKFVNSLFNFNQVDLGAFEEMENTNERALDNQHKYSLAKEEIEELKTKLEQSIAIITNHTIEETVIEEKEISLNRITEDDIAREHQEFTSSMEQKETDYSL